MKILQLVLIIHLRQSRMRVLLRSGSKQQVKRDQNRELLQCPELESAVNLAETAVQRHQASSLLLSPACASFDQYRDFEARGEHFRTLINPLLDVA